MLRRIVLLSAVMLVAAVPASAATTAVWRAYLFGPGHQSHSTATVVTTANAAKLVVAWHWQQPAATPGQPADALYSSPTVAGGSVYIGSATGVLFALNESTGAVRWSRDLGHTAALTCPQRGITSTATVVADPSRGGAATVYTAGGDGNLYALNAATGNVVWKTLVAPQTSTQNTFYNWSSPTVVAGRVYMGLSSQCDDPLIRGGVVQLAQATGALQHTWNSVPQGAVGGSVWTSVAATSDGASVFATTGNGDDVAGHPQGDSQSIVSLAGATLARTGIWTVPPSAHGIDSDFGGSPVIYRTTVGGVSTQLVAACNKNGILYAWRTGSLGSGPLWQRRMDAGGANANCLAAPAFDGTSLFQAAGATTIGGTSFAGSVRALVPATGAIRWQRGLAAAALGSASVDDSHVLAVPTQTGSAVGVYLLNAQTGAILKRLTTDATFAQPVFADGFLFTASVHGGLTAWRP
jgi:outer membrane protein assembly factor BamB